MQQYFYKSLLAYLCTDMKSSILFFSIKVVFVFAAVFQVNQLKAPFFGASEARVIFFLQLVTNENWGGTFLARRASVKGVLAKNKTKQKKSKKLIPSS